MVQKYLSLMTVSKALFLLLWIFILIHDLFIVLPDDWFSWARLIFSLGVMVLIGLETFGLQFLRRQISARTGALGRGWFVFLYAVGIAVFISSLFDAIAGIGSGYGLGFSLIGTGLGLVGLSLLIVDWIRQSRRQAAHRFA